MTTCTSCAKELPDDARFCLQCGTPIADASTPAEYKQVTVLFADVVHSMEIAARVGPEKLREIMAELFDRSAAVVERYGGTVDKFTGDGIMAVFGAPTTLEDHAFRACLAALDIQKEIGATSAPSDRPELGPSHRRRNRFGQSGLHGHRRAGRHGATDGIRRAAGRRDAQRVDGAIVENAVVLG